MNKKQEVADTPFWILDLEQVCDETLFAISNHWVWHLSCPYHNTHKEWETTVISELERWAKNYNHQVVTGLLPQFLIRIFVPKLLPLSVCIVLVFLRTKSAAKTFSTFNDLWGNLCTFKLSIIRRWKLNVRFLSHWHRELNFSFILLATKLQWTEHFESQLCFFALGRLASIAKLCHKWETGLSQKRCHAVIIVWSLPCINSADCIRNG